MTISKSKVNKALITMEERLFDGRNNADNPNMPVPLRLIAVFSAAYIGNYFPPEGLILRESYKLLCEKGYYYDVED